MNNVEFLRFFETARIDYIHQLLPGSTAGQARASSASSSPRPTSTTGRPAFFGDDIRTYVWVSEIRRSALRVDFEMLVEADGRVVAEGYGWLVGYDYDEGRPQPLPDELRERLEPELRDPVG